MDKGDFWMGLANGASPCGHDGLCDPLEAFDCGADVDMDNTLSKT